MGDASFRTQLQRARSGETTPQMLRVAEAEELSPDLVRTEVAAGRMIIPANRAHPDARPFGIGIAARCKVNANIGTSSERCDPAGEIDKAKLAVALGSDTVMDLSTGGDLAAIRAAIVEAAGVPIGTVPVYEAASGCDRVEDLDFRDLLAVVERQARSGVDYMTIHAALRERHLDATRRRTAGIVSRGGSLMACWMVRRGEENPFYTHYDELLEVCRAWDVALSLGDGLRPGCLADAGDEAQYGELDAMGELVLRAREAGVQVMVEGPGHVPMHEVKEQVERALKAAHGAPFYVLGPLVTDVAPGYDHITSAIGGALAAWAGASMLCYVTPSEHLGLPGPDDVRRGVVAARIAAHAADIARGRPGARERDRAMGRARHGFDWEGQFRLSLDPDTARRVRRESGAVAEDENCCTMCGPHLCAMRLDAEVSAAGRARR